MQLVSSFIYTHMHLYACKHAYFCIWLYNILFIIFASIFTGDVSQSFAFLIVSMYTFEITFTIHIKVIWGLVFSEQI